MSMNNPQAVMPNLMGAPAINGTGGHPYMMMGMNGNPHVGISGKGGIPLDDSQLAGFGINPHMNMMPGFNMAQIPLVPGAMKPIVKGEGISDNPYDPQVAPAIPGTMAHMDHTDPAFPLPPGMPRPNVMGVAPTVPTIGADGKIVQNKMGNLLGMVSDGKKDHAWVTGDLGESKTNVTVMQPNVMPGMSGMMPGMMPGMSGMQVPQVPGGVPGVPGVVSGLQKPKPMMVKYDSMNNDPKLRRKMNKYYYEKILNEWIYDEMKEILTHLSVKGGKVKIVKGSGGTGDKDKKIAFLAKYVITQRDVKKGLMRYVYHNRINWWELKRDKPQVIKFLTQRFIKNMKKATKDAKAKDESSDSE